MKCNPGEGTLRESIYRRDCGGGPSPQPAKSELRSSRPREGRGEGDYFHTDLSASQRWPFNCFASASIEPLSSSGSAPSSSAVPESSERLSFGPVSSSAVVVTGLDTHSMSLSDVPGLSEDTNPVTSTVSVRPSSG